MTAEVTELTEVVAELPSEMVRKVIQYAKALAQPYWERPGYSSEWTEEDMRDFTASSREPETVAYWAEGSGGGAAYLGARHRGERLVLDVGRPARRIAIWPLKPVKSACVGTLAAFTVASWPNVYPTLGNAASLPSPSRVRIPAVPR